MIERTGETKRYCVEVERDPEKPSKAEIRVVRRFDGMVLDKYQISYIRKKSETKRLLNEFDPLTLHPNRELDEEDKKFIETLDLTESVSHIRRYLSERNPNYETEHKDDVHDLDEFTCDYMWTDEYHDRALKPLKMGYAEFKAKCDEKFKDMDFVGWRDVYDFLEFC